MAHATATMPQVSHDAVPTTAVVDGQPLTIPRILVRGTQPGPTLTVTAAQHGRELNGIEAVRRLLEGVRHEPLLGTLQLFPVVNPPATRSVRQVVPGETQNLNRIWPGDAAGTNTERIAAAVAPHVAASDYLVDLHGWSDWTVDVVLTGSRADKPILDLARAFGLPFVFCNVDGFQPGNLKTWARANGCVAIGVELTPQWRLREAAVQAGLRGLINVLRYVRMLPGEPEPPPRRWVYDTHTEHVDLLAEQAGLWVQRCTPGAEVRKGELFGELFDLDTLEAVQAVRSPMDGVVINIGPCHEGVECNTVPQGSMLAQVWAAEPLP